ncbi:Mut7-C RNAse domain-containing protein [Ferroplasma sp.]|uniref:Mut7-C RNAse domain-containing protein n=1 Tax=Ferroplasma sp. TaxID=2591003 RepID=UPI00307EEF88
MLEFMADHMLGRLCKWLRLMGYNVQYPQCHSDNDILKKCQKENLILLTRDYEFYRRYDKSVYIDSPDFKMQLRQMAKMYPPDPKLFFTRCPECNALLQTVKTDSMDASYESVKSRFTEVKQCPVCKRYYWEGSHYGKILVQLNEVMEG